MATDDEQLIGDELIETRRISGWVNGLMVLFLVYLFLVGIKMMGGALEMVGKEKLEAFLAVTDEPIIGLFIGVLATAIIRSSSLVTSLAVGLCATGSLSLGNAVPIIMGANIGTSVTNVLVSLMHIRRKDEFRRAFGGAIVHDLFNWCTVLVFFPIEWISRSLTGTGYLEWLATWLTSMFVGTKTQAAFKPLDYIIKPIVVCISGFLTETIGLAKGWAATILIILSLVLLLAVLWGITKVMRGLVAGKIEGVLDRFLFRNALIAYLLGMVVTAIVQSSSVTTSLVIPLLGAGLLTLEQIYPYTIGANVGTTITAFLAALALMSRGKESATLAVTAAVIHLLFNLHGTAVFYPLRAIPINGAKWYANLAAEKPRYAAFFVLGVFFVLPGVVIAIMKLF